MKQVKSAVEAKMKGVQYSPVNNCTEFAGRVFVEATGDVVEFRQDVSPLLKDGSDPDRKLLATLAKQMLGEKTSVASPGQLGAGISRLQT